MEIIYRADDGTEFRNQTDCLLHERMSNLSHNKVIKCTGENPVACLWDEAKI